MTTKAAILHAIRHKCLDCAVHQPIEVRECPVTRCTLWPFRFGMDPNPSQSRGFAKSTVYTGDFEGSADERIQAAEMPAPPEIGPLHASFSECGAILADGEC